MNFPAFGGTQLPLTWLPGACCPRIGGFSCGLSSTWPCLFAVPCWSPHPRPPWSLVCHLKPCCILFWLQCLLSCFGASDGHSHVVTL